MRVIRYLIVIFCCSLIGLEITATNTTFAQDGTPQAAPSCAILAPDVLKAAKTACDSAKPNSVCLGNGNVQPQFVGPSDAAFAKQGDQVDLAKIDSLAVIGVKPPTTEGGSVAVLKLKPGVLAESTNQGVSAVLFGDAVLKSTVDPSEATKPTLPAASADGNPVLLRGGAGNIYPSALKLMPGQKAVVDGRSKGGDWLRVRLENGVGWTRATQLNVTGDVTILPEREDQDGKAGFLYSTPMQSFILTAAGNTATTGNNACAAGTSGLLLQYPGGGVSPHLSINGADVSLNAGTFLVHATPKDRLEFTSLVGSATVSALGGSALIASGQWVRIRVGGQNGIIVSAPPPQAASYPFNIVDGVPADLLPGDVPCTVGLPANVTANKAAIRVGPGTERGSLLFMRPDLNYVVSGWANDSKSAAWWQIKVPGKSEAWIEQSIVHHIGACDKIPQAAPPPVVAAVDAGDTGGGQNASTQPISQGFAPTGRTIWQADPGPINSSGTCSGVPVAYCAQLVALTPSGTGFLWKGQELKPYYMRRIRENTYAYTGPNILGDARIELTLVFTSATSFKATQIMVMARQAACTYSYSFAGTFLR